MIKNVELDYDFSKLLSADYAQHSGSCIKHQIYELTDIHEQYGGFPKSYTIENTLIHQLWWDQTQLDFDLIGKQLGIEVVTISTVCQPPGNIIPWHRDTFYQIGQQYPERKELKVRANIHLENYKMGHFIQYQEHNQFRTSTDWTAGQGLLWDSSVLHLGANAGFENKLTMQVSGFLIS
jgi:hypothetical protein